MERGFAGHDGNYIIFKLLLLSQGGFPGQKNREVNSITPMSADKHPTF
jgi:hypothetical protein